MKWIGGLSHVHKVGVVVEEIEGLHGLAALRLLLVDHVHEQMEELVAVVLLGADVPVVRAERAAELVRRVELVRVLAIVNAALVVAPVDLLRDLCEDVNETSGVGRLLAALLQPVVHFARGR